MTSADHYRASRYEAARSAYFGAECGWEERANECLSKSVWHAEMAAKLELAEAAEAALAAA